jgi:Protein of unknown function (DUF2637)
VSYWHAFEVIRTHGESGATARLEPVTIDGLVYASSMMILYAARHRLAVPSLARWLLALGILATLAANVAHGWAEGPVGAVVAAWPAASLVGSYELLLWLVRTAADGPLVQGAVRDQVTAPTPEADAMPQSVGQDLDVAVVAPSREMAEQEMNEAAVAAYRESLQGRKPLSERKLVARYGKTSHRWARNRIAEARLTTVAPDPRHDRMFVPPQRKLTGRCRQIQLSVKQLPRNNVDRPGWRLRSDRSWVIHRLATRGPVLTCAQG